MRGALGQMLPLHKLHAFLANKQRDIGNFQNIRHFSVTQMFFRLYHWWMLENNTQVSVFQLYLTPSTSSVEC